MIHLTLCQALVIAAGLGLNAALVVRALRLGLGERPKRPLAALYGQPLGSDAVAARSRRAAC